MKAAFSLSSASEPPPSKLAPTPRPPGTYRCPWKCAVARLAAGARKGPSAGNESIALWTEGRLRRVRSSVDKAVEVMGGLVVCSRREGVSRMSRVCAVFRPMTAVEIVERIDARSGDCRVWCVSGVAALCNPGDAGGSDLATREGAGPRVDAIEVAFRGAGTAPGTNSSLKPSTNANRPCCCSRARSRPYLRVVSATASRPPGSTYHSFPSLCTPEC